MTFKFLFISLAGAGLLFGQTSTSKRIQIQKDSRITRPKLTGSDPYQEERVKILAKRRKHLIHEVKSALKTVKDLDQRAELQLRLANLYIEEFKFSAGEGSESRAYLQKAQGILKDLLKHQDKLTRKDELLFQLAQSYLEFGQTDNAIATFHSLLNQYPNTSFKEEAYLQIADNAFEKSQFKKALDYFSKIISNESSPVWLYSHYKSAWAHYNLDSPQGALKHFKIVVEAEPLQGNASHSLALKKEAIRDICLPLADLKRYEEGKVFYKDQGEPYLRPGLECLASLSQERGDWAQALDLYQSLLALEPHYKANPDYSLARVDIYRRQDLQEKVFSSLEESLDYYLGDSTWKEIFSSDTKSFDPYKQAFEETSRKIALDIHAVAQKTKNPQLYIEAQKFYELYLKFFPLTVDSPKIAFYRAEILYHTKHYDEASSAYAEVYRNPHAATETRKNALNYALMASLTFLNESRKKQGLTEIQATTHKKRKASESETVEPYSEVETTFLNLSGEFIVAYPKDDRAAEVLFQAGYLQYLHQDNKLAYQSFWKVIQNYPSHKTSLYSGLLLLDVLNQREDYPTLITASKKLLSLSALKDPKFEEEVSDVLRKSELKEAEKLEKQESYAEAARAYLKYNETYSSQDKKLQQTALYNASVCFTKAQMNEEALRVQESILKNFPTHPERASLLLQIAKTYESTADFAKAATYFSLYHTDYPKSDQSAAALRLSGLYFWGSAQNEKAETAMLRYLSLFPQDRAHAEKDLLDFYSSQNEYDRHMRYLLEARAQKGVSFSDYLDYTLKLADLKESHTGKEATQFWNEAKGLLEKYSKILLESKKGLQLMGRVLLRNTQPKQSVFSRISLQVSQAQLEKNLTAKLRVMKELETDYGQIVKLGGDSGFAALYWVSKSYFELAKAVSEAPIPSELTPEQIDIYRTELSKNMVLPFREKALLFSSQCLEKAQELNALSPWISSCYSLASQMDSSKFPFVQTFTAPPYYSAYIKKNQDSDKPEDNHFFESPLLFKEPLKDRSFQSENEEVKTLSFQSILNLQERKIRQPAFKKSFSDREEAWSYLNSLRLFSAENSIKEIKVYLRNASQDFRFHNLLALAYLDSGDLDRAKITWLSLVARGVQDPAIWNNLGVVEALKGNSLAATHYFEQASDKNSPEGLMNQAFIALKYRNGHFSKSLFSRAMDLRSDDLALLGQAISLAQVNEWDESKSQIKPLQKKYPNLPLLDQQMIAFSEAEYPERSQESPQRGLASEEPLTQSPSKLFKDRSSLPEIE